MRFKYQARTKTGELQGGFIEAANRAQASAILSSHDLFILSVEPAEKVNALEKLASIFTRVKRKDLVVFTRQLAIILQAQLSLSDALKTLKNQTENEILRGVVGEIYNDVTAGLSFSQALERHTDVFSNFYVSMIRSAEVTGSLDTAVNFLADYLEKEDDIIGRVKSAMTYPIIVVVLFVGVAAIMVTTVFPQLAPVFANANVQLPIYTQILIGSGNFATKWWPAILIVLILAVLIIVEYMRSPEGKALWDDLKIRLPILKKVYLPLTMARFTNAAAVLLKGGIPVTQALEITSDSVDNAFYREILHNVTEAVRQGSLLSEAFQASPYFPPLVSQMVGVGEVTGQLEQTFTRLSNFYTRETDKVIGGLVDLIQPLLMIVIGAMVGLLFAAVLIPLYSLTSSF